MQAEQAEAEKQPPPLPQAKDIEKMFQYLPQWAQTQWLLANNWNAPSEATLNLEALKNNQDLIKD